VPLSTEFWGMLGFSTSKGIRDKGILGKFIFLELLSQTMYMGGSKCAPGLN